MLSGIYHILFEKLYEIEEYDENTGKYNPLKRTMKSEYHQFQMSNKHPNNLLFCFLTKRIPFLVKLYTKLSVSNRYSCPACYQKTNMLYFRQIEMYQNRKIAMHDLESKLS